MTPLFSVYNAGNGFIVVNKSEGIDGEVLYVFQDTVEEEGADADTWAAVLRHLTEAFGPMDNRYSKKRVYVRVEPGDKYEPQKCFCPIENSNDLPPKGFICHRCGGMV